MDLLWFLLGIPLATEILAAALGCRDLMRHHGLSSQAIERLVLPTVAVGAAIWFATPAHWAALGWAALVVTIWQAAIPPLVRATISRRRFWAQSIDTDDDI